MQIKNRHTGKEQKVSFSSWYNSVTNKKDFIILDWDLVFWQTIENGEIKDHRIMERDHTLRIITSDDIRNTVRELTDSEWSSLKNQFYDSPEVLSTTEKKQIFKSKELIKSCYKEGLFFDDYYMNHLKRRITRDAAKRYLVELYNEKEIQSLPLDFSDSKQELIKAETDFENSINSSLEVKPKKNPENQNKNILKSGISFINKHFKFFATIAISIGIFSVGFLNYSLNLSKEQKTNTPIENLEKTKNSIIKNDIINDSINTDSIIKK